MPVRTKISRGYYPALPYSKTMLVLHVFLLIQFDAERNIGFAVDIMIFSSYIIVVWKIS